MAPQLNLGGRLVGGAHRPLVIAEIGINHGGSLDIAKAMVDAAARAGVEVVKHQTHVIDDEMSELARQVIPGNACESIWEIMQRCALSEAEEAELKAYVESRGMFFLSTPFSRAAVDRLERLGVTAYKIGSGECNNTPLVEKIARLRKPVILSTGMNGMDSISRSVSILRKYGVPFALLHCTNLYPTPFEKVRLDCITELREAFPDAVIGLSDHTTSAVPCVGAIALGASIVERHFTDTYERSGPDIACSMDETQCRELVESADILFRCRGGGKAPLPEEQVTQAFAFATVVAERDLAPGDRLDADAIWVKRPGTGEIPASRYDELVSGGWSVVAPVRRGQHLSWRQIAAPLSRS